MQCCTSLGSTHVPSTSSVLMSINSSLESNMEAATSQEEVITPHWSGMREEAEKKEGKKVRKEGREKDDCEKRKSKISGDK